MPIPIPETLVDQVMAALGVAASDGLRRARVKEAVRFYVQVMAMEGAGTIASHVQGIDLSWPVERVDLLPDTEVVAYRYSPQQKIERLDPFGMYFTEPGVAKHDLGIRTDDRRFVRYAVRSRVPALKSRAKTGFVPGFGAVYGGATQYVIPSASRHLRVVHVQHAVR